ncbi:hypothetical protein LZC95_25325 [Pendulispora brunnea]|uniref:Uncharacterized protein n=1 Tax=Pendulispora brunnea TaxID=2905690 RepID=A0ABZ2KN96_9BACT
MNPPNYRETRRAFMEKFEALRVAAKVEALPEWYPIHFPDDSNMVSWISASQQRAMRVQEAAEDRLFGFDFFISKAGIDYELTQLTLDVEGTFDKSQLVFEIYQLWFIDQMSPERLKSLLDEFVKAYAKEGAVLCAVDDEEDE